jgi:DNA-directed RNA polymerase specialized sigma24 family protein
LEPSDFHELPYHLIENNEQELSRTYPEFYALLYKKLIRKLKISEYKARDLVSHAVAQSLPKLRNGYIDPVAFFHYVYTSARNQYFTERSQSRYLPLENISYNPSVAPPEINDQQPLSALYKRYVPELVESLQETALYLLENPNSSSAEIAVDLGITAGSARIRKYRIINKLRKIHMEKTKFNPPTLEQKAKQILQDIDDLKEDYSKKKITRKLYTRRLNTLNRKFKDLQK